MRLPIWPSDGTCLPGPSSKAPERVRQVFDDVEHRNHVRHWEGLQFLGRHLTPVHIVKPSLLPACDRFLAKFQAAYRDVE